MFIHSEMQAKNKTTQAFTHYPHPTTLVFSKLPAKWIHMSTGFEEPASILQCIFPLLSLLSIIYDFDLFNSFKRLFFFNLGSKAIH